MDAQQELFTRLKISLESKGYSVYDGTLPPDGTPYPFIYLGDFSQDETENKSAVMGTVNATIHIWSNTPKNRGTVSAMISDVKAVCRGIEHTDNHAWLCRNTTQMIIPDNTTNTPLLHGVVQVVYKFS